MRQPHGYATAPPLGDGVGFSVVEWSERWTAFPREHIEQAVEFSRRQENRFFSDAIEIQRQLDAGAK
jgi:hypothetical protein